MHDQKARAIQAHVSPEVHRALKTIAAQTDRTIGEILAAKVAEVIASHRPKFLDAVSVEAGHRG